MTDALIDGGRLFYWDPRRNKVPFVRRYEIGPRVGNFGDLLGPLIVRRILEQAPRVSRTPNSAESGRRIFAVGSVMHFAADGDTVWGTGVNGKVPIEAHRFTTLDVRAVRGPLTRDWLARQRAIEAPEIYGDPALLIPQLLPESAEWASQKVRRLGVVPNFHDVGAYAAHPGFIDPKRPPLAVLEDIARSEMIAASSLHGVIVAEAFGIPAVLLPSKVESPFKYLDYAQGTGREKLVEAPDLATAESLLDRGGFAPALEAWQSEKLLSAFPFDRFSR